MKRFRWITTKSNLCNNHCNCRFYFAIAYKEVAKLFLCCINMSNTQLSMFYRPFYFAAVVLMYIILRRRKSEDDYGEILLRKFECGVLQDKKNVADTNYLINHSLFTKMLNLSNQSDSGSTTFRIDFVFLW